MRNRLLQHWSFLTQTAQTPDSVISLTLASRIQKTHRFEILKFILNQKRKSRWIFQIKGRQFIRFNDSDFSS